MRIKLLKETEHLFTEAIHADLVRLFDDILQTGASLRMKVTGRSMAPFLKAGEVVTVSRVPFPMLRRGDLILFRTADNQLILHRIIRKKRSRDASCIFLTKGDAAVSADNPISDNLVLGKVTKIARASLPGRTCLIDMDSSRWVVTNRLTALLQLFTSSASGRIARRSLSTLWSTFQRFSGSLSHS